MKGKKLLTYVLASSMSVSLLAGMTMTVGAKTIENASVSNDEQNSSEDVNTDELSAESEKTSTDETMQELYDNFNSGFNEDGSVDTSAFDYQEGSEAEELSALDDETYPATFDLRHVDGTVTYNNKTKKNDITGGTSYVTPVKFQNPWGTCWAFGTLAAAETSILSEADLGTETVDNNNIDLSEHHLSWFAKNHIPAPGETGYGLNSDYIDDQWGEGIYYSENSEYSSMEDGETFYAMQAFASGMGVVSEEDYPYRGKNGAVVVKRKDTADTSIYKDYALAYKSIEAFEAADEGIRENYSLYYYYKKDDWSIDESERFKQDYALEEGNVLPTAAATVGSGELNVDGINAFKEELINGKAVCIGYRSDQFSPSQIGQEVDARYINSNYAQYCWDSTKFDHCVCIVGWDDDYDASNFGQKTVVKYDEEGRAVYKLKGSDQELKYDKDGKLYYVDSKGEKHEYDTSSNEIEIVREDGSDSVPPGNGAWIVKNSWGAATNEFPNCHNWGVDGSGYFYLSYYDTSICSMESYDFAVTDEEKEDYDYSLIDQYDLMIPETVSQSTAAHKTVMANVFTADENMEITVLSSETTTPGTTVTYGICLLSDGEDYPSSDDEIKIIGTETYKYGGYHSIVVDDPVIVAKGQKYAVIALETYEKDGTTTYCICGNSNYAKDGAGILVKNGYDVGVINPGESYIGTYGYGSDEINWTDYYDFVSTLKAQDSNKDYYTYDNFSLKAYGKPTSKTAPVLKSAVNTKSGIKVTWESNGDGYNYRLFYREAGTEKWNAIVDTDDTSYTVTGLESGTEYDFTVRCTDENGMYYVTLYDKNGVSCTYLPYLVSKAGAVSDGINISWAKVSGASGYNIYRKSGTSDYEEFASVNGSVSSYKDTSAKEGVLYTYKVKAYAGLDESASKAVSALTLKTPVVKLSSTKSGTVTVKWSKNTKATGYQIKYKVGSKIKYITIKKASTVKKVLKKLESGKICKVKVRSYKTVSGKNYYSGWSSLKKVMVK